MMIDPTLSTGHEIAFTVLFTLGVTVAATILGALAGIPLGAAAAFYRWPGRRFVRTVLFTLCGFPPVVSGLVVYMLFRAHGPLGDLGLLFSPTAVVIAEFLLVTPLVAGLTMVAVVGVPFPVREALESMGARGWRLRLLVLREARAGVLAGVMIGFGRAVAEVGAAMIAGGNIRFETRTLGTAIVVKTGEGGFEGALWLALLLVLTTFVTFYAVSRLTRLGDVREDAQEGGA